MFKKIIRCLAIIVFFAAMILLRPAPSKTVVVAAAMTCARSTLVDSD